jgi:hypothetical protein
MLVDISNLWGVGAAIILVFLRGSLIFAEQVLDRCVAPVDWAGNPAAVRPACNGLWGVAEESNSSDARDPA